MTEYLELCWFVLKYVFWEFVLIQDIKLCFSCTITKELKDSASSNSAYSRKHICNSASEKIQAKLSVTNLFFPLPISDGNLIQ